ncbi:MAG TPA: amino acid permease [Gemmatimonadales bacterium]|nr:amino acid permease [Gemmatimonadales bacterium]
MPPRPYLSTLDAVALIVGLVVGVGIFRAPQLVAENTGSVESFLGVWAAGGLLSLIGALCYAELTSAYPNAGGEYHFLRRAFGSDLSFLFAWSRSSVIQTGSIAILAYVFADYMAPILSLDQGSSPVLAVGAVVALTGLNLAGLRHGKRTQVLLTLAELIGLGAVIIAGLILLDGPEVVQAKTSGAPSAVAGLGLAMVFVLLTYGGWNEAAYISAEVKDGPRAMARTLLWGIGIITTLYLLVNLAYVHALGLDGISSSSVVAADVMHAAFGPAGATLLSLAVAVSALGSANATIITGARTTYALGRDFGAFHLLGRWNDQGSTPVNALFLQGVLALILVAFGAVARGGFETMVAYTAPVFWFFLALAALSVIVLRQREPERVRPFRVPLYPFTPLVFFGAALFMLYSSVRYAGTGALVGVAVMLAGVPVLFLVRARSPQVAESPESG